MAENKPYFELKTKRASDLEPKEIGQLLKAKLAELSLEERSELEKNANANEKTISNKYSMRKAQIERQIKALGTKPEEFSALYNLRDNINGHIETENAGTAQGKAVQPAQANLKIDEGGNLSLKIGMIKPVGVLMEVVDGRIQFSPEDMDPEKMRAMVDFLERHGLTVDTSNLKLNNADEKTQELFDNVKANIEQESYGEPQMLFMRADSDENSSNLDDAANEARQDVDNDVQNDINGNNAPTADENAADDDEEGEEEAEEEEQRTVQPKQNKKKVDPKSAAAKKQLAELNKSITGWMDKNKRKGYSWFEGSSCGGWKTFTAYGNEVGDDDRKPFSVNPKTKEVKCNYEFKIYTRIGKDGKIEIAYSLPPGKTLTDDQADLITSALKDAGVKNVEFDAMSNSNEAVMRNSCGKQRLIPNGHKINAERYDKMVEIASKKVDANSPELYRYKYDLAMQMKANLEAKGMDVSAEKNRNNPDCRRIRWAAGAYQLHPFRDLWEDFGLRGDFEKAVAKGTPGMAERKEDERNGASQVIGATMAVVSLYQIYEANMGSPLTVKDLLDGKQNLLRTEEERNALRAACAKNNDSLDTNVRDLSPRSMRAVYAAMTKTETAKAKENIEERYFEILKNNQDVDGKGESPEKAVNDCLNNARTRIEDVNGQLEDCDLKKIYLTRFSLPRHDFTEARAKAIKEGLIEEKKPRNMPRRPDNQQSL